jgi:hypothetical protein
MQTKELLTADRFAESPELSAHLRSDEVYVWRGQASKSDSRNPNAFSSCSRLRIWRRGDTYIALFTDLSVKVEAGCSVTNCAENLIAQLTPQYDLPIGRTRWFNHVPNDDGFDDDDMTELHLLSPGDSSSVGFGSVPIEQSIPMFSAYLAQATVSDRCAKAEQLRDIVVSMGLGNGCTGVVQASIERKPYAFSFGQPRCWVMVYGVNFIRVQVDHPDGEWSAVFSEIPGVKQFLQLAFVEKDWNAAVRVPVRDQKK